MNERDKNKQYCADPDCEGMTRCPCMKPEYHEKVEREILQAEQAARVMPCIGPLLDAYECLPNDVKDSIEQDAEQLHKWITDIQNAVYCDA